MPEHTGILLEEIGAWTAKYERLRSLVAAELGLPDIDAIAAAEARGYARAVALLRSPEGRSAAAKIMFAAIDDESLNGRMIASAIADYLEAAKETR